MSGKCSSPEGDQALKQALKGSGHSPKPARAQGASGQHWWDSGGCSVQELDFGNLLQLRIFDDSIKKKTRNKICDTYQLKILNLQMTRRERGVFKRQRNIR